LRYRRKGFHTVVSVYTETTVDTGALSSAYCQMMTRVLRRSGWIAASMLTAAVALCVAGGIVLCESALHVPRILPPVTPPDGRVVEIEARDGARLRAWFFVPKLSGGSCVLILHGVADSRRSQMGLVNLLLQNHYSVLAPDSRAHGDSGGDIVTYGVLEADDIHRWVDWLEASQHPRNVFGLGASLGAGILLQSLAVEHRFRAVHSQVLSASRSTESPSVCLWELRRAIGSRHHWCGPDSFTLAGSMV